MNRVTSNAWNRRRETGSVLLALAALIAAGGAVLIAVGESTMRDRNGGATRLSSKIPPIDAEAPAAVETMSFGLG